MNSCTCEVVIVVLFELILSYDNTGLAIFNLSKLEENWTQILSVIS